MVREKPENTFSGFLTRTVYFSRSPAGFGRALVRLCTNSHENQFWKNRRFFQNWFWFAFAGFGPSRSLARLGLSKSCLGRLVTIWDRFGAQTAPNRPQIDPRSPRPTHLHGLCLAPKLFRKHFQILKIILKMFKNRCKANSAEAGLGSIVDQFGAGRARRPRI